MRRASLGRREILWGMGAVVGLAAAGQMRGILGVVYGAEAIGEKEYVVFFGKFGKEPFAVIEKPKGSAFRIKPAFALRQMSLDGQQVKGLLTGMEAKPVDGVPGVVVYTTGKGKPAEIIYPGGADPYVSVADPSERGGTGEGGSGGGGGGGGGCFTPETLVLMADGSRKPIGRIELDDAVRSWDFRAQQFVTTSVRRTFRVEAPSVLLINGLLVTDRHPFAVGMNAWQPAADLRIGQRVLGERLTEIRRIERLAGPAIVVNLSVSGPHNFFVAGSRDLLLVHNKGGH